MSDTPLSTAKSPEAIVGACKKCHGNTWSWNDYCTRCRSVKIVAENLLDEALGRPANTKKLRGGLGK